MKDFLGNDIYPGDIVVYGDADGVGPKLARVLRMTPQRVEVSRVHPSSGDPHVVATGILRSTKKPGNLVVVSQTMQHLSDHEVWLHFEQARAQH